jgi:MurNAc alpha-1-phosphate uridylyltransferase
MSLFEKAPEKAFVLAAGRGERMRPLTETCPKPLLEVGGSTMLDRTLDALAEAGVRDVVVNAHYLGGMIVDSLKHRTVPRITLSVEESLLDTGGGVRKMLPFFKDAPFYVLNADIVWTDGSSTPALTRLAQAWDSSKMDLLLLLHATQDLPSWNGRSDYYLAEGSDKPVFFENSAMPANYIFTGLRIVHPRLFDGVNQDDFSFLKLFHKAEAAGRLFALPHDGAWHHVGTPEAYAETNRILSIPSPEKKVAP